MASDVQCDEFIDENVCGRELGLRGDEGAGLEKTDGDGEMEFMYED